LTHFGDGLKGGAANNAGIEEVDRSQNLLEFDIDTHMAVCSGSGAVV
jgi:hypothetical protein